MGKEKGLSASYLRRFRPSAIGCRLSPLTRVEKQALAGGIGEFVLDMWLLNDTAQVFFKFCGFETYRSFRRKQIVPGGKAQGEDD
jgi:hypothetical protein